MMGGRHDAAFADSVALASLVINVYAKEPERNLERYNPAQAYRER